jgi:hypothetical protein
MARGLGGRWDKDAKVWIFKSDVIDQVREICKEVYGVDGSGVEGELVTIRVTVNNDLSELHSGIYLGGRQIAQAYGRDSGARIGEGVAFIKGNPASGGSVKNWRTCIPQGCVFLLLDFPKALVSEISDNADLTVEVVEANGEARRKKLEDRKAKLEAALVEVNAELAELQE